jgi:Ti-type conjugative transfer relaxase TraA
MTPRINVGKGVTGAVRYVLGPGRDPKTGEIKPDDGASRVSWISGQGFGFSIENAGDADLARRMMEFDALNQGSRTRQCEKDCVHLTLSWAKGEQVSQREMESAARGALKDLGMENAKALFIAHNDEDYAHVHIVASKINPGTGRAYDLERSKIKLSDWALGYERERGGVVSLRRQDASELRTAIRDRDAGGALEAMTKQRSTFTANQLHRALEKEILRPGRHGADRLHDENLLGRFFTAVMARPELVELSKTANGPTERYTTRAVLEAELHVLRSAEGLASDKRHEISDRERAAVLGSKNFAGVTRQQAKAFRHATGAEGLSIIDGQAGTGKSFTMAAVRQAYEKAGYRVIGLGPTNAVAQDMRNDGFGHAGTVHSELFALNNNRTSWNRRTVVMVDEAAMLDTKMMAMVTAHAQEAGSKLILLGDDRQLSSIDRGGMFGVMKDRYGCAELSEVKRQHKIDERRAAEMMAEGNFHDALGIYDQKGAIHWTRTQGEARAALVDQWSKDSAAAPDKSRFVFAYTNDDVNQLNAALRDVKKQRGELGQDHEFQTAHGRSAFATGDRIQFTGTDKKAGLMNGAAGRIEQIDGSRITLTLDGKKPEKLTFDASAFDQFRHGYAGTIYRGQGRTLDQTYLYHSEHWRSASSYVALTRHREKTAIFVARNTLNVKRAAEPWMMEKGGAAKLSQEHHDSAQRSYAKWSKENPELGRRHGFESYVQYVQQKWAENDKRQQQETGSPDIRALARQMGRVDDRRAASMFYAKQNIGPIRPFTARETLEKFAGSWARREGPELRPTRPQIVPEDPLQQKGQPEARRAEMRSDDQARADSRQQQANESDKTEATARNNPERGRQATRSRGRSRTR